jgi:hypothetical protein
LSAATSSAGLKSGTVTVDNLDITTFGGTGKGANDPDDVINVTGAVLDHARPSFSQTLQTTLTVDFGIVEAGTGLHSLPFDIYNLEATQSYTAGLDLDVVNGSGSTAIMTSNLAPFSNLTAGSSRAYSCSFDTAQVGNYSAIYNLGLSDENLPGANSSGSQALTLVVQGRALTRQWIHDGNGNWSSATNWVGAVPGGAGAEANFKTEISGDVEVLLDGDRTVGSITFDSPNSYAITGTNTLTLQQNGGTNIHVLQGSHCISTPIAIENDLQVDVNASAEVSLTGPVSNSSECAISKTGSGALYMEDLWNDSVIAVLGGSLNLNTLMGNGTTQIDAGCQLTVSKLVQNTLNIASGGKLIIRSLSGGPLSVGNPISVPEPHTLVLICTILPLLAFYLRKILCVHCYSR